MPLQAVADIVRTTLGPRAMLKMLLDANGGIVLTNDGNAILREIDVSHPAAKSIIELSRTQDEEVRDSSCMLIKVVCIFFGRDSTLVQCLELCLRLTASLQHDGRIPGFQHPTAVGGLDKGCKHTRLSPCCRWGMAPPQSLSWQERC